MPSAGTCESHGEVVRDAGDEGDVRRTLSSVEAVFDLDAVGVDLRHAAWLRSLFRGHAGEPAPARRRRAAPATNFLNSAGDRPPAPPGGRRASRARPGSASPCAPRGRASRRCPWAYWPARTSRTSRRRACTAAAPPRQSSALPAPRDDAWLRCTRAHAPGRSCSAA